MARSLSLSPLETDVPNSQRSDPLRRAVQILLLIVVSPALILVLIVGSLFVLVNVVGRWVVVIRHFLNRRIPSLSSAQQVSASRSPTKANPVVLGAVGDHSLFVQD